MFTIKWHLRTKQLEKRVHLHHDSERDEEGYIESNIINNYG